MQERLVARFGQLALFTACTCTAVLWRHINPGVTRNPPRSNATPSRFGRCRRPTIFQLEHVVPDLQLGKGTQKQKCCRDRKLYHLWPRNRSSCYLPARLDRLQPLLAKFDLLATMVKTPGERTSERAFLHPVACSGVPCLVGTHAPSRSCWSEAIPWSSLPSTRSKVTVMSWAEQWAGAFQVQSHKKFDGC